MTDLLGGPDGLMFETEDPIEESRTYPTARFVYGGPTKSFVTVDVHRRGPFKARAPRVAAAGHDVVLNHDVGSSIWRRLIRWEDRRTFVFLVDPPSRKGAS